MARTRYCVGRAAPGVTDQARALILDFGGVVTRTLFETHAQSEAALGLAPGTLTWRGPFAPGTDSLWRSMQAGEITERDYWHRRAVQVAALVGAQWSGFPQFLQAVRGAEPTAVIRPQAIAAVAAARQAGVKLAILSNELDLFYGAAFRDKLPLLHAFDVISDATHTGILKPDPRAYLDVAKALSLTPRVCLFVDDQPRNVQGAQAVGMQTVAFDVTDPDASYARALVALGITETV